MSESTSTIGESLQAVGTTRPELEVRLSRELVGLLSEQLYQSPLKAIEELVVNSFDADAGECRLYFPEPLDESQSGPILVWDDGVGMDEAGLADLWHVGHSAKRTEQVEKQRKRKQIGKFGIGKLATYAIAERVTYVTRSKDSPILTTTLDYGAFKEDPTGGGEPVRLQVSEITAEQLLSEEAIRDGLAAAGVEQSTLDKADSTWTLVILERFRPRVEEVKRGRLRWVLGTAMPLRADFALYANDEPIRSSKENYEAVVKFEVSDLPPERLERLSEDTGLKWHIEDGALVSAEFPTGIRGEVIVTRRSLHEGKSADLRRSHGFFVYVRGRLVNLDDALFGLDPLSYKTFNRFRADLDADDLDAAITAPREGAETTSPLRLHFEDVLAELFYEARARFERWEIEREGREKTKREDVRNFVDPRLVERPVADALIAEGAAEGADQERVGTEADEGWFYLKIEEGVDLKELLETLYADERAGVYGYERTSLGRSGRLVEFDPSRSLFRLNADHELVMAHDDEPEAQALLEDVVTAEALLEVYLREQGLSAHAVGEVLERRDLLLRSLTRDRLYSLAAVAENLRQASDDQNDLEITLVVAARSLGFVAKHIGGSDEPDGIARLTDYPAGEQKITLEAKSSGKVP
ncbi:MAG: ATP-binding protein, partial [Gaiellaceae bacterium]